MKINDIKIGVKYAATDGKRRTHSGSLPRRVEALEIVPVEQDIWTGGGYSMTRAKRTTRQVKVRCLDEPRYAESYRHERVMTAPAGTELVLEARFLAAPWSDVRTEVLAKIKEDQAKADAEAATEKRIRSLLPKRMQDDYIYITSHKYPGQGVKTEAKLEGRMLDHILALAEKGATE